MIFLSTESGPIPLAPPPSLPVPRHGGPHHRLRIRTGDSPAADRTGGGGGLPQAGGGGARTAWGDHREAQQMDTAATAIKFLINLTQKTAF